MANYGVQKSTMQGVLSWYEDQEETKFSIFRGNKENDSFLTFAYNGNDKEEGHQALYKCLSDIETTDFNTYFLKLYNSQAKNRKAVAAPGITFQLHSPTAPGVVMAGTGGMDRQVVNEILAEIRSLRAERLQMEAMEEEEEDLEPEPQNILAGIIQTPQMQNLIVNILGNLMTPKAAPAVNGIPETATDAEVNTIIENLFAKGVTVADLQKLAAMDQGQINFLLSMLRK